MVIVLKFIVHFGWELVDSLSTNLGLTLTLSIFVDHRSTGLADYVYLGLITLAFRTIEWVLLLSYRSSDDIIICI
jgi:hypothetical protein